MKQKLLLLFLGGMTVLQGFSQGIIVKINPPEDPIGVGEINIYSASYRNAITDITRTLTFNKKDLFIEATDNSGENIQYYHIKNITLFANEDFVAVVNKKSPTGLWSSKSPVYYAITNYGRRVRIDLSSPDPVNEPHFFLELPLNLKSDIPQISVIDGDDLYTVAAGRIYRSNADVSNWQIDTSGLLGAVARYVATDSFQNVYAATSTGLFMHGGAVGATWSKVAAFPASNCYTVHVDIKNRLFVADNSKRLYISTDNAASFTIDTLGLMGNTVNKIASDSLGNLYVMVGGSNFTTPRTGAQIFRAINGLAPFTRIDEPLSNRNKSLPYVTIYNNIVGSDSTLYASTLFGAFYFRNGTWFELENPLTPSKENFDMLKGSAGRIFVSNHRGIHYSDSTKMASQTGGWKRSYPETDFLDAQTMFRDNSGSLYALGLKLVPSNTYNSPRQNMRSDDNGVTWFADTAGVWAIGCNKWFVAKNGTMYAAKIGLGLEPVKIYSKPKNGVWALDINGFVTGNNAQVLCFGEDNSGAIYIATTDATTKNYKKPFGSNTWEPEINGLNSYNVYVWAQLQDGTMLAGCYEGLFKKVGGAWVGINRPNGADAGLGVTASCFAVCVDSLNRLWAAYNVYNASFFAIGTGVYYSTDAGNSWSNGATDTVTFQKLVPMGDTVYGVSYYNGIFRFSSSGVLPLQFISLEANPYDKGVRIDWRVSDAAGVKAYIVERSSDGAVFGEAGLQPVLNSTLHYSFFDPERQLGTIFYRIRAVKQDGNDIYSSIVKVSAAKIQRFTVNPNPVNKGTSFSYGMEHFEPGNYSVRVIDASGKIIASKSFRHGGGSSVYGLPLPGLVSGIYFIRLEGDRQTFTQKIVFE